MIKKQLQLFIKHRFQLARNLSIPIYLIGFILMIGYNLFSIFGIYLTYVDIDNKTMVYYLLMNQYIPGSLFICISYSFLRLARNTNIEEMINGIKKYKYQFESIKVIFIIMFLYSLFLYLLITLLLKQDFFTKTLQYTYFYKVVFTFLALTLLSIGLSFYHTLSKLFIFILMIFTSPINTMFASKTPTFLSIDKYFYYLSKPFEFIQYQNNYDPLYGINTSLAIYLFIISLLVYILYRYMSIRVMKYLSIAILICSLIITYYPKSEYTGIESWYTLYQDYQYYDESKLINNKLDYTFKDYQMRLSFPGKLKNTGKFTYISSKNHSSIYMTINHAYHIKLTSSAIQSYVRMKDYIKINFKQSINQAIIHYEITGIQPAFYTNRQACLLPGYVAWYPFPGKAIQYIKENSIYGYNLYNRIKQTQFKLWIDAPYSIDTNLIKNGSYYEGISDSVTIVGGQLIKDKIDKKKVESKFNQIFHQSITLPNKIIYVPRTLFKASNILSTVSIFNDYMILDKQNFMTYSIVNYYVYSNPYLNEVVKECISYLDFDYINNSDQYIEKIIANINDNNFGLDKKTQTLLLKVKTRLLNYKKKYGSDKLAKHIGEIILNKAKDDLFK